MKAVLHVVGARSKEELEIVIAAHRAWWRGEDISDGAPPRTWSDDVIEPLSDGGGLTIDISKLPAETKFVAVVFEDAP